MKPMEKLMIANAQNSLVITYNLRAYLAKHPGCAVREISGGYRVGGHYYNGYLGKGFTVLSVDTGEASLVKWSPWSVTVQSEDGEIRTHCTALDRKYDAEIIPAVS